MKEGKSKKVIAVDDSSDHRFIIRALCHQSKIQAEVLSAASDVIKRLKNESTRWDALLTDYRMPITSGIDLIKEILSKKTSRFDSFVIFSSQAGASEELEQVEADYPVVVRNKPLKTQDIDDAIELGKKKLEKWKAEQQMSKTKDSSHRKLDSNTKVLMIHTSIDYASSISDIIKSFSDLKDVRYCDRSGAESEVKQYCPDVILLNWGSNDEDAREFINRMKNEIAVGIPTILFSQHPDARFKARANELPWVTVRSSEDFPNLLDAISVALSD